MILSTKQLEAIQPMQHYPSHTTVADLLETIRAMSAALEAWAYWLAGPSPVTPRLDRAIALTKAAGIEWMEEE